jgi:hypothetical protein
MGNIHPKSTTAMYNKQAFNATKVSADHIYDGFFAKDSMARNTWAASMPAKGKLVSWPNSAK